MRDRHSVCDAAFTADLKSQSMERNTDKARLTLSVMRGCKPWQVRSMPANRHSHPSP